MEVSFEWEACGVFLGIDIGTSSVKAVLVDENDKAVAQASAPLTVSRPQPLFSEQEPEAWWQAMVSAMGSLPAAERSAVHAIGLSGQMHGATLLDRFDRPLRSAILWNDGRSARECLELEALEPRARSITGNIVMPGFTAPKLLWVRHNEPEIFRRTASVLLPKDYVRLKLTGEKVSDMSDASGTSWLDVAKRDWSDEMLAATGLDRSYMPRLVEGSAPSGTLRQEAAELLQLSRVVVAGGGGDNAASAVGMGVVEPGQAFLSLGTSGVLFVVTDRFRPNPDKAAHAFCHCIPGRWHQMAVLLTAASALDWVVRLTGRSDPENLLAAAQARGLRRGAPFFLPYLSGERTPHNDPYCRGVFFGMTSDTTDADLAVAVLEGVALAFADGMDVLLEGGGEIGDISVTGGGARSPYWGQLLAAALNRPLTYRQGGEIGAAFGAARLARMALSGEVPETCCPAPPVRHVVEPNAELSTLLADRRRIFTRLYRDLKNAFEEFSK
jgi:xylulokinase